MEEEQQAPASADTSDVEPGEGAEQVNWQERYENLQPAYTQATQRAKELEEQTQWLSQLQSDPDVQKSTFRQLADVIGEQEALQLLGYAEDGAEDTDPLEALQQRQAALEAQLEQQSAQAQESQQLEQMDQFVSSWFAQPDHKLSDKAQNWIISRAVTLEPAEGGMPDLQAAFEEWQELRNEELKDHVSSKRRATRVGQGTAGTQQFDINDPDERTRRMAAILEAGNEE